MYKYTYEYTSIHLYIYTSIRIFMYIAYTYVVIHTGDGGTILPPAGLFATAEKMANLVRSYFKNADVWLSAQQFSERYEVTMKVIVEEMITIW